MPSAFHFTTFGIPRACVASIFVLATSAFSTARIWRQAVDASYEQMTYDIDITAAALHARRELAQSACRPSFSGDAATITHFLKTGRRRCCPGDRFLLFRQLLTILTADEERMAMSSVGEISRCHF